MKSKENLSQQESLPTKRLPLRTYLVWSTLLNRRTVHLNWLVQFAANGKLAGQTRSVQLTIHPRTAETTRQMPSPRIQVKQFYFFPKKPIHPDENSRLNSQRYRRDVRQELEEFFHRTRTAVALISWLMYFTASMERTVSCQNHNSFWKHTHPRVKTICCKVLQ